MLWDTSLLDAQEGIRFRGLTIEDIQEQFPKPLAGQTEPLPESMLWLLMTGEIPTAEQTQVLGDELRSRAALPQHVVDMVNSYPKNMHPMTQFSSAVLAMQTESEFAAAYMNGINKKDYWKPCLEDSLTLIARLPRVAAMIYRNVFHDGKVPDDDDSLDYAANFNRLLGFEAGGLPGSSGTAFDDLMRLYLVIHTDHEGGNVSAHATHLVGSALSDPYLSFSAGLNGLAGPLHGLANQEVLRWTLDFQEKIKASGKAVTKESIEEQAWVTLNSGNVIPGFGHAVLRKTDPRYTAQRRFALDNLADDELFQTVSMIFEVMPKVLTEHGKTQNPWPNVDAHSGCLLRHYGLTEYSFYTVLFGLSRAQGVLAQLVWDRALGMSIERPKSVTLEWMRNHGEKYLAEHPDQQ